jgi:hypothetical protein
MSAENDVPLGEGARRYYEQQFADRIRQVRKGGGGGTGKGGSGWNGRVGIGLVAGIVLVVLRILFATGNRSPSPSYNSTPPPPVQFNFEKQKLFNDPIVLPNIEGDFRPGVQVHDVDAEGADPRLVEKDVPLLQGLCYRIDRESRQPVRTPGRRLCQFLDAPSNGLISRAAAGENLARGDRADLFAALNRLLQERLYDGSSFRDVPLPPDLLRRWPQAAKDVEALRRFNRTLLEKCYSLQIVPLAERDQFNDDTRVLWQLQAQKDLAAARRRYEGAKR